ncbi:MAG: 30S ribosomal protein S17 [Pseudomonadota bacterium]|nr:30S ribosomal protein S17 [Pseudomonadota bacterium]
MDNSGQRNKRTMVGLVTSDKMDKTVVVEVSTKKKHPTYKKYIRSSSKYKAHDALNQCALGDTVAITECRPLSKDKCWRVSKVVVQAIK